MATKKRGSEKKIIKPGKEIIAEKLDPLKKKLLAVIESPPNEIVLDFGKVDNIDMVGLGMLVAAYNSMKSKGKTLTLINVKEELYRFFSDLRLNRHFHYEGAAPSKAKP